MFFESFPTRVLRCSEEEAAHYSKEKKDGGPGPRARIVPEATVIYQTTPKGRRTPQRTYGTSQRREDDSLSERHQGQSQEREGSGGAHHRNHNRAEASGWVRPRYYSPSPPERTRVGYTFYEEEEPWAHLYAEAAQLAEKRTAVANEWARLRTEEEEREHHALAQVSVHKGVRASDATFDRLVSYAPRSPPSLRSRSRPRGIDSPRAGASGKDISIPVFGQGHAGTPKIKTHMEPPMEEVSLATEGPSVTVHDEAVCECAEDWLSGGGVAEDILPQEVCNTIDDLENSKDPSSPLLLHEEAERGTSSGVNEETQHTNENQTLEVRSVPTDEHTGDESNMAKLRCISEKGASETQGSRSVELDDAEHFSPDPRSTAPKLGSSDTIRYSTPQRPSISPEQKRKVSAVRRNKTPRRASPSPSSPVRRRRPVVSSALEGCASSDVPDPL